MRTPHFFSRISAVFLAAALASSASFSFANPSDPVAKITGPGKSPAGFPVILSSEGSVGSKQVWIAPPADSTSVFLSVRTEEGHLAGLFLSSKPGIFHFALVSVQENKVSVAKHALTIELAGPTPPVPPLPPVPGGKFSTIIVEESKSRTPSQGNVITSKAASDYLSSKDCPSCRVFDKDVVNEKGFQDPKIKSYVDRSPTLPFVFLIGDTGAVLFSGPLPADESAFLSLLKKFGG